MDDIQDVSTLQSAENWPFSAGGGGVRSLRPPLAMGLLCIRKGIKPVKKVYSMCIKDKQITYKMAVKIVKWLCQYFHI